MAMNQIPDTLSVETEYLNYDFSYQGLPIEEITTYAEKRLPANFSKLRQQLISGQFKNKTEGRKVTHVLNRSLHNVVKANNGKNRFNDIVRKLRSGRWLGATGKAIADVVNIGVGGSDLGPMMTSFALKEFADDASMHELNTHFVSSMDGGQLYAVLPIIDPETTLFIIASKSFSTIDTLANVATVKAWVQSSMTDAQWLKHHVIGVSANNVAMNDFGIPAAQQLSFADSVGGRFSMWSAIGLPIALTIGVNQFGKLLEGANAMDQHFANAPLSENIPLLMALIGVFNREERGINNLAILPYDGRLRYLPSYMQQLDMESNGKQCNHLGKKIEYPTGPIIWGGFGPNGQHAFFQHLHQGWDQFTADFIMVLKRKAIGFEQNVESSLQAQQRLAVSNCLAHRALMWEGVQNPANACSACNGSHPTNLLFVDELTPQSFGAIIAAYEHKVFTQGVIWEINSFDQPGVEQGKQSAAQILDVLEGRASSSFDSSTNALTQRL